MSVERRYPLLKHTHTVDEIEGDLGGGSVESVTADEVNVHVDNTDPANPVVSLSTMPEATVKGREEGTGTGDPVNLTMDELRAMLHLGNGAEVRGASFVGFNQEVTAGAQDVAITIKEDCTIVKVVVLTMGGEDVAGSCVIDIWKEDFADYPADVSDSICAAAKPTVASGEVKYQDSTLTGWTTALSADDTLIFHLEQNDVFTAVFVFLVLEPVGSQATDGYTDERAQEIVDEAIADLLPFSVPAVPDTIPVRDGDAYIYAATPPAGDSSEKVATTEFVTGTSSLADPGYYERPDGLIEQWGFDTRAGSSPEAITFPIPFPNAVFTIHLTSLVSSGGSLGQQAVVSGTPTTTGFNIGHADSSQGTYWRAIGN
jgi:hypothetical protein